MFILWKKSFVFKKKYVFFRKMIYLEKCKSCLNDAFFIPVLRSPVIPLNSIILFGFIDVSLFYLALWQVICGPDPDSFQVVQKYFSFTGRYAGTRYGAGRFMESHLK